jgi:hypothetical protein
MEGKLDSKLATHKKYTIHIVSLNIDLVLCQNMSRRQFHSHNFGCQLYLRPLNKFFCSRTIQKTKKSEIELLQLMKRSLKLFFFILYVFVYFQFKYLDKDEFKDLKHLRRLHLDNNQLSVVVDYIFQRQRNLLYLGRINSILFTLHFRLFILLKFFIFMG